MTSPKRGLGRGLEALLAEMPTNPASDKQNITSATALVRAIQQENRNLLQEAEALKALLEDFEALIDNFNPDPPI